MVCFVNSFAKLSIAKSDSYDDIRKGNLHNENTIFVTKRASQTNFKVLSAISNSTTRNYQMKNLQS
jgi:hypothetical protein